MLIYLRSIDGVLYESLLETPSLSFFFQEGVLRLGVLEYGLVWYGMYGWYWMDTIPLACVRACVCDERREGIGCVYL